MTNQKAIEVITHFDKHIIPCDEYGYRIDSDLMEAHLMAAKALRNEWIPVTERLPEHGQEVIVYSGNILKPTVFAYQFWNPKYDSWKHITHWMPLPIPPKGE